MTTMAKYACKKSFGRFYDHKYIFYQNEDAFQIDVNKIISSLAFRRLEYKTQVFLNDFGDHYRTRMTHSLDVARIARVISRNMKLNDDLAEAIALAHDIGHPPFGHAGEAGLNTASKLYSGIGFDHNANTIKMLTVIEKISPDFMGLNLSWEVLDGLIKHNGPLNHENFWNMQVVTNNSALFEKFSSSYASYPSLEAQVASVADDIAYCSHDIDDGIRAGLFSMQDLSEIADKWPILRDYILRRYPKNGASDKVVLCDMLNVIASEMMRDLIHNSTNAIQAAKVNTYEEVTQYGGPLILFSEDMMQNITEIKSFLMKNMYRHHKVNLMSVRAKSIVHNLFVALFHNIDCLPPEWQSKIELYGKNIITVDYIAGMTDRFAIDLHTQIVAGA